MSKNEVAHRRKLKPFTIYKTEEKTSGERRKGKG